MDITSAETKATYDEIKKYVAEHNAGMKVSNLYISQVKRKCGIEVGKNYNLPKNEDSRQPQCPEDKESAIVEPLSKKPPLQNQRFKWWEHVTFPSELFEVSDKICIKDVNADFIPSGIFSGKSIAPSISLFSISNCISSMPKSAAFAYSEIAFSILLSPEYSSNCCGISV